MFNILGLQYKLELDKAVQYTLILPDLQPSLPKKVGWIDTLADKFGIQHDPGMGHVHQSLGESQSHLPGTHMLVYLVQRKPPSYNPAPVIRALRFPEYATNM